MNFYNNILNLQVDLCRLVYDKAVYMSSCKLRRFSKTFVMLDIESLKNRSRKNRQVLVSLLRQMSQHFKGR